MNTRTCTRLTSVILLAFVTSAPATYAATATDNMVVRTNVVSNCRVGAGTMDFGAYDKTLGNETSADVKVTCTIGQKYDVGINLGNHASGTTRRMANNSSNLPYALFKDSARTVPLLDTADGLVHQDTGTGAEQTHTVWGRINGAEPVVTGPYQDTLLVTVTYL